MTENGSSSPKGDSQVTIESQRAWRLRILNLVNDDQLYNIMGYPGLKPIKLTSKKLRDFALTKWNDELLLRVIDYITEGTTIECRRNRNIPLPKIVTNALKESV